MVARYWDVFLGSILLTQDNYIKILTWMGRRSKSRLPQLICGEGQVRVTVQWKEIQKRCGVKR